MLEKNFTYRKALNEIRKLDLKKLKEEREKHINEEVLKKDWDKNLTKEEYNYLILNEYINKLENSLEEIYNKLNFIKQKKV